MNRTRVDVEDIESGRIQSTMGRPQSTEDENDQERNVEEFISPSLLQEIKKKNELLIIEQSKQNSKNIAESLRKKQGISDVIFVN